MENIIFLNGKPTKNSLFALYHARKKKYLTYDPVEDSYKTCGGFKFMKIWDYQHYDNAKLWAEQFSNRHIYIKEIPNEKISYDSIPYHPDR